MKDFLRNEFSDKKISNIERILLLTNNDFNRAQEIFDKINKPKEKEENQFLKKYIEKEKSSNEIPEGIIISSEDFNIKGDITADKSYGFEYKSESQYELTKSINNLSKSINDMNKVFNDLLDFYKNMLSIYNLK